MPVNYQQIQKDVKRIGQSAPAAQKLRLERLCLARELLLSFAGNQSGLDNLRIAATKRSPGLRCAIPGSEPLTLCGPPPPQGAPYVLLAADGSQINPDRHDQVEFAVINTGAIRILPGLPETPQEIISTELLYGDELQTEFGPLTEEIVAMRRDRNERTLLACLAAEETLPVVTLTDGQLELFREPQPTREFEKHFAAFKEALHQLAGLQAVTAGYVDKPRADLVVRLLELTQFQPQELDQAGRKRPLGGITDAALFHELLQPGQRSAVFGIQSKSAGSFDGDLALHFFYLNVGRIGRPWLARIEMPAWVSDSTLLTDRLHTALVDQCHRLGSKPYPYALHRAHEVAVVRFEEKEQLETMIINELRRQGIEIGEKSYKQSAKDISGSRMRYS